MYLNNMQSLGNIEYICNVYFKLKSICSDITTDDSAKFADRPCQPETQSKQC